MPGLTLRLLGPPEVARDGAVRRLGAKAVALLAYLALSGRSPRRELARMLWPEASDPLNSLSAARTATVRVLGEAALAADPDTLGLGQGWTVDALDFCRLDPPAAWGLWQGELLAGFRLPEWSQGLGEEFEAWLYAQRDALLETRRNHAMALAAHSLQDGELVAALPYLEVAAGEQGDPREDAARRLLLALGALDRPGEALGVYSALAGRLQGELGVEPTATTREALALVRSGHPRACLNALHRELAGTPVSSTAEQEARVPMVGRDAELRWLREQLGPVLEGRARAASALILGEPGAGKSRLASEYAARLARQRTPHLLLCGQASQAGAPLQLFERPLRDALRAHPARLEALNPLWRAALAQLLPDVLPPDTEMPAASVPPELALRARQEALRAVLLDPRRPTLLILDDLQWADGASVDLALELLRNPPEAGLALLFTARSSEDPQGSLRRLAEVMAREGLGRPLPLAPLDQEAVAALAFELGRDDLNAPELHRLSGGNPFFLLELLRAEAGTPPERVGSFLSARLAGLPELERQVLGALAVLGDGQGLSSLRRTSGRSEAELDAALEALRAAAWLRLDERGASFAHDLTRQVMLHELSSARLALLHLRAARALRERPVQAAPHYWASQDAWDEDDLAAAHAALLGAGAGYALRGDLDGGLLWFDCAQEAFSDPARRGHSLVERARVLERYGRIEEALGALDEADLLLSGGEAVPQAAARVMRAQLLAMKLGRLDEAQAISERVLSELEGREGVAVSLVRSDALNVRGWVLQQRREWQTARESLQQGLAIRRTLQDFPRMAASLSNLGPVLWKLNDPEAESVFRQCAELCQRTGDVLGSARANHNLGMMRLEARDIQRAVPLLQQAYREHARLGNRFSMAMALTNAGAAMFGEGHYALANHYYAEALAVSLDRQDDRARPIALANLAETALCLGDEQACADALARLDALLGQQLSQWSHFTFYCLLRADLAAVRGSAEEVFRWLRPLAENQSQDAEVTARLRFQSTDASDWASWARALTRRTDDLLRSALTLEIEDWRLAYLYDALAASSQPDAAAAAQARRIRATFQSPPDPFLQELRSYPPRGGHL